MIAANWKATHAQAATLRLLTADGFTVDQQDAKSIRVIRGNDHRLIQLDGTQKRAVGAKR